MQLKPFDEVGYLQQLDIELQHINIIQNGDKSGAQRQHAVRRFHPI